MKWTGKCLDINKHLQTNWIGLSIKTTGTPGFLRTNFSLLFIISNITNYFLWNVLIEKCAWVFFIYNKWLVWFFFFFCCNIDTFFIMSQVSRFFMGSLSIDSGTFVAFFSTFIDINSGLKTGKIQEWDQEMSHMTMSVKSQKYHYIPITRSFQVWIVFCELTEM